MKRIKALCLVFALFLNLSVSSAQQSIPMQNGADAQNEALVRTCILYNGSWKDQSWRDTLSYLEQSLLLGLTVETVDVSRPFSLDGYDVLYLDPGIHRMKNAEELYLQLVDWVKAGGSLFLPNEFYDCFAPTFLGAKYFVPLRGFPSKLSFPAVGDDLGEIQEFLEDFSSLYPGYINFEQFSNRRYGYAMATSTATALVKQGDYALYTMNDYGQGRVFFTNPLLPNYDSVNGFSLTRRTKTQGSAANMTITGNQLIYNAFAAYVSKQLHGYSVWRVYGCFGTPSMTWELHYEDITAFQYNSTEIFGELCRKYQQIPSFSLIRSPYWWFLRAESVTYLLGQSGKTGVFLPDKYENVYSSGAHVVVGDEWLSLGGESGGSYFVDYPGYTYRAFPYPCDWNGDGLTDLVVGCQEGRVYYYQGQGFSDRLRMSYPKTLLLTDGRPLSVGSYSAPVAADLNGDGIPDLLSGSGDGKLYLFLSAGKQTFEPAIKLLDLDSACQVLPDVCDLDGDGLNDLLIGTSDGRFYIYYGAEDEDGNVAFDFSICHDFSAKCSDLGPWIAPRAADVDGDGTQEILIGTYDGYVAILRQVGSSYFQDGFLNSTMYNYKGNLKVKIGNNCVPCLLDLNGDGTLDLLTGTLEYGLSYPIDSEYFPYSEQLRGEISYIKDNHFYLSPHILTGDYVSSEWEQYELSAHLRAMDSYGAEQEYMGTNQHTWRTSRWSQTQTFENIWNAGLLWNSGYQFSGSTAAPEGSEESVIAFPFFLELDGEKTLLLQNCCTMLYVDPTWPDISAKYDMPICVYYHCDFAYTAQEESLNSIKQAAQFQSKYKYNFVREDQMMLATTAAYQLGVTVSPTDGGENSYFDMTFTPTNTDNGHPLWDDRYAGSSGFKICFSEKLSRHRFATDASVWHWGDRSTLYVSADRPVRVYDVKEAQEDPHLTQVNIAAQVEPTTDGIRVTFLDDGMMQAFVNCPASTTSEGWTVRRLADGSTKFTKYGEPETLEIVFQ